MKINRLNDAHTGGVEGLGGGGRKGIQANVKKNKNGTRHKIRVPWAIFPESLL
jgi:hypothetical protein